MSTATVSPADSQTAETLTSDFQAELRATAIREIHRAFGEIQNHVQLADLLFLRDALIWADSNGSILTGIAVSLDRVKADAIWVEKDHFEAAQAFAEKLKDEDVKSPLWPARMRLIARIIDAQDAHLDHVGWALDALDHHVGYGAPEEAFLYRVLMLYGTKAIDAAGLKVAIEELQADLKDVARDSAHFADRFPNGYDPDLEWPTLPDFSQGTQGDGK